MIDGSESPNARFGGRASMKNWWQRTHEDSTMGEIMRGIVSGKCSTLQEGESSVSLCEPETL